MTTRFNPSDEYNNLRNELLQSKKYVFERPLIIITFSLAGLNFIEKEYVIYLPPMAIGLLIFNLWFTVNRMKSIARIVSYIQIELEKKEWEPWLGWESSLRYYRRWMKKHRDEQETLVEEKIDRDSISDAIGYYPTIFWMHVCIVLILFFGSLLTLVSKTETGPICLFILTLISGIWFIINAINWKPNRCKNLIEEDIVRWELVFEYLTTIGIKNNRPK